MGGIQLTQQTKDQKNNSKLESHTCKQNHKEGKGWKSTSLPIGLQTHCQFIWQIETTPNETGTRPATSTPTMHLVAGAQCCHISQGYYPCPRFHPHQSMTGISLEKISCAIYQERQRRKEATNGKKNTHKWDWVQPQPTTNTSCEVILESIPSPHSPIELSLESNLSFLLSFT